MHDTLPRNVTRHNENAIFGVDFASYPTAIMLHDCIRYDMTLQWWMGVVKSRYQFISSSRGFLSMVTPWFVSVIDNTRIWTLASLKRIFQVFDHKCRTAISTSLSMVASDNILGEKQYFEKFWSPQKNLSTRLFIPFLKYQVRKIT